MYTQGFNSKRDYMTTYVDEFETLFGQLDWMGADTEIPKKHKAPLLLASMGNNSPVKNNASPLPAEDTFKLAWKDVTSDLIQEWNQI